MSGFGTELRNRRRAGRDRGDQGFGKQETTSLSATETANYVLTQTIAFTSHLYCFQARIFTSDYKSVLLNNQQFHPPKTGQCVVEYK